MCVPSSGASDGVLSRSFPAALAVSDDFASDRDSRLIGLCAMISSCKRMPSRILALLPVFVVTACAGHPAQPVARAVPPALPVTPPELAAVLHPSI